MSTSFTLSLAQMLYISNLHAKALALLITPLLPCFIQWPSHALGSSNGPAIHPPMPSNFPT